MSNTYKIHVVKKRGDSEDLLFTYTGETHPHLDHRIDYGNESYLVNGVRHVLGFGPDSCGHLSCSLDFVEVVVY